jgi:hypothetical protein
MSDGNEPTSTPFHVEQHESLPEVLERLRGHREESLTLVIPDHSPVLLTASEFRALKDLADRQRIRVTLQTRDTLRLQLASMFGLAKAPTRADVQKSVDETDGSPRSGSWQNVRRPRHRVAGQPPEAEPEQVEAKAEESVDDPIAVSRRRRNRLSDDSTPHKREKQELVVDDAGLDYIPDDDETEDHSRAWLIGRIAAAVLALLLTVGVALWWYMPAVEVDVTLREAEVSSNVIYSVAAPGANLPSDSSFAVEAVEQSEVVPFTIEIPVSGEIREPDSTATGAVLFRNISDAPVTVEEGVELTTVTGASYLTLEATELPAGSVDSPGEATVEVTAAQAGEAGNREAGALTGKLPDVEVYYSNLSAPIDGGSDRVVPEITDEDVDAALTAVQQDLRAAAVAGWATELPDGQAIVEPSVQPTDPQFQINGSAGDQVPAVTVTGTVSVTGLVYDLAEVEQQARSSFEVTLQDQVPPGYGLDVSTITLGEPELVAESPQNVEYRVSASATAVAIFDEGARQGLRDRMVGESADDARAEVESVGAIESSDLSHSPGWWPDRMPQSADRITLTIREAGNDVPDGPATPVGTPDASAVPEDGS